MKSPRRRRVTVFAAFSGIAVLMAVTGFYALRETGNPEASGIRDDVTPGKTITRVRSTELRVPREKRGTGRPNSRERLGTTMTFSRRFATAVDTEQRIELAWMMTESGDPEDTKELMHLLPAEKDMDVREEMLRAAMVSASLSPDQARVVLTALQQARSETDNVELRVQIYDAVGKAGALDGADFLLRAMHDARNSAEQVGAGENIMRIWRIDPGRVDADAFRNVTDILRRAAQAAESDAPVRTHALMGLALDGQNNLEFFRDRLAAETDPGIRRILEQFITDSPETGPAPVSYP